MLIYLISHKFIPATHFLVYITYLDCSYTQTQLQRLSFSKFYNLSPHELFTISPTLGMLYLVRPRNDENN